MKTCSKCGMEKELVKFSKTKKSKNGLHCWCKTCCKKDQKKYYKNNVKKIKDRIKEYYKQNSSKRKRSSKEYYKQNKDKKKEYGKEYRNSFALYNIFAHQISYADEVRLDPKNYDLLQVKCTYCKEWFNPTIKNVQHRIAALEGKQRGELRLYCSDECKKLCTVHYQHKYPKDQKPNISFRDTQAQWAEMVKERDNYKCIKCGSTEGLTAHHREGILWNPLESADIDIGVTLCSECNKAAHSIEGCSYSDMRCPK